MRDPRPVDEMLLSEPRAGSLGGRLRAVELARLEAENAGLRFEAEVSRWLLALYQEAP